MSKNGVTLAVTPFGVNETAYPPHRRPQNSRTVYTPAPFLYGEMW